MADGTSLLYARDEEAAAEALHAQRRTDGLPIVVPTPERVERMIAHSGGLDGDIIIGDVAPAMGRLTVEKAAVNAVMAGCPPEIFPLVIAACSAITDPQFELAALQATTHSITPFVIVNGPAREMYGIQSGIGALGPGFRANATLGRAVRLVMMNVGGGLPGIGDMATIGSPAKFTCCMGEAEEESPWEPLHVSRGFDPSDSTVTVVGVEGPHSFIFDIEKVPDRADKMLRQLGAAIAGPGSNNIFMARGVVTVILQPLHVNLLAEEGLGRLEVQQRLYDYSSAARDELTRIAGIHTRLSPYSGDRLYATRGPEDFLLMVGGAEGGSYSAFMPTWCGGTHGQNAITRKVRFGDVCEIPSSARAASG